MRACLMFSSVEFRTKLRNSLDSSIDRASNPAESEDRSPNPGRDNESFVVLRSVILI